MNWQEIKEKYQKAFSLLDKTVDMHWELEPERYQRLRFLYDFFDEQGILISIISFSKAGWFWDIRDRNFELLAQLKQEKGLITRTEAEEQAFLKAFEILEEQL